MVTTQSRVDFTVLVEIRGDMPGTVVEVEEEDHAFADVDEEADLTATSVCVLSVRIPFLILKTSCIGKVWRKGDDALS